MLAQICHLTSDFDTYTIQPAASQSRHLQILPEIDKSILVQGNSLAGYCLHSVFRPLPN